MSTFEAPNDYRNYLCHYGVKDMKRPSGLKYKKRNGQTLREHRLNQVRKTGALQDMEVERDRRLRERRGESYTQALNEHSNIDREYRISQAEEHDEEKRRQQEILEEHMRQEAERRANTKGGRANGNTKRMQNFANQLGIVTPGRHRAMNYQQQIENRRRRRHGH